MVKKSLGASIIEGVSKVGKGLYNVGTSSLEDVYKKQGIKKGLSGVDLDNFVNKSINESNIIDQAIGRKLNKKGLAMLYVGSTAATLVDTLPSGNGTVASRTGPITFEQNMDRLVSIDGSGFVEQIEDISGGDFEIMNDIVKHTFNGLNQQNVSGEIVFALHNMREG